MRINEIFYSLQGEGHFTGVPSIFIRFAGCNLKCPFCDTQHEPYEEMSMQDIIDRIKGFVGRHVVFTGGEPSLQLTADICRQLKDLGYDIQVETNGTHELPEGCIDWVTCSPKDAFCKNAEIKISHIDEVKVVFDGKTDVSRYLDIDARCYSLQPCDTGKEKENKEITAMCVDYILAHPEWRLSLQTHKILYIR